MLHFDHTIARDSEVFARPSLAAVHQAKKEHSPPTHGLVQSRDTLRVCLVALEEKRERRFTPMTATRMDADGRNSNKPLLAAE